MQGIMKWSMMGVGDQEREREKDREKQRKGSESWLDGVTVVGKYVSKTNKKMTKSHKKIMLRNSTKKYSRAHVMQNVPQL